MSACTARRPSSGSHSRVARERHRRLSHLRTVALLAKERWSLPNRDIDIRQWLEPRFVSEGLPMPVVAVESDSSQLAFCQLVRQSDLLAVMPHSTLSHPAGQGLVPLTGESMDVKYDLHVFWRTVGKLSPVSIEFREALLEQGRGQPL
jgi:DNA-binding transcriptional LysR family regulator